MKILISGRGAKDVQDNWRKIAEGLGFSTQMISDTFSSILQAQETSIYTGIPELQKVVTHPVYHILYKYTNGSTLTRPLLPFLEALKSAGLKETASKLNTQLYFSQQPTT